MSSDHHTNHPITLNRTKISLFLECPLCFYLDINHQIPRPQTDYPSINTSVKKLLKKEFDLYRADKSQHPIMKAYGLDTLPFTHQDLGEWQESYDGLQTFHGPTSFIISGSVDDVWHTPDNQLVVVDYKSTSQNPKDKLEELPPSYTRQMEIYQWILRQKGFTVSNSGYFIVCQGKTDRQAFDAKLEFDVELVPYQGNTDWIEPTLQDIRNLLSSEKSPVPSSTCQFCSYREKSNQIK